MQQSWQSVMGTVLLVASLACSGPILRAQTAADTPLILEVTWKSESSGRSAASSMSWKEKRKLLTLEDLEKVTGLKGLKPGEMNNERDQMLVFSKQEKFGDTPADFIVLSVNLVFVEGYWEGITKQGKTSPALVPVSGVGDQAFEDPRDPVLYFRKGKATVIMTFSLSPFTSKPYVTAEQMRELAKIMAGRL